MNNQQEKNLITDKVLNKIKSGEVKMKPKIYFILRTILFILGALVLVFFIIYFISFIIFSLRASGVLFLPKFGLPGMKILFSSLPWLLILMTVILIMLLEIFAKKFTFVYRRPIVYSLLIIIMIVFMGSILIDKTPLHLNLFHRAQERHLPGIGMVYRDFGAPRIGNLHYGVVSEITDNGFRIKTSRSEVLSIVIIPKTRIILKTDIKQGDAIVVLGKQSNGAVQALNIYKVKKDINLFKPRGIRDYKFLEK